MRADTRPVRASETLDWTRLAEYLRQQLPSDLGIRGELHVEQFAGGHSNLTYLLRFGETELVLRRPPLGPLPPRAHDMAREARVLMAVHPHFPLAPRPYLLCEDASIIGAPFYVMERRRGIVLRGEEPPDIDGNVELRARISASVVDTLADLHAVDVTRSGLDALGKAAGFVPRQIDGWTGRWNAAKTSDVAEMDSLTDWLEHNIPADSAQPALVHGDYKLDNVMLDASAPNRLAGVFDWEMSAIGDPLVDVGILLCYWVHVPRAAQDNAIASVTTREGWFDRDEILDRYSARSGATLDGITTYEVFALFKLAVVIQQIYARYVRGQTDDPRFASLGAQVALLARTAVKLAR
jgi:aminoglycoside phosphotransferase (APT) family kinase protein